MSGKETIDISFFKSIIDQDRSAVVICNLNHEIIYMNPAAIENYGKRGGDKLIGQSLLECHNPESREKIQQVVDWFAAEESHNIVYTFHNEKQNKDVYMVALRDGGKLIGYYEKHEYRNLETMKLYDLWCKGKGQPMKDYSIANTTKEERIALIKQWIPDEDGIGDSGMDLWDIYADYINGTREIAEINASMTGVFYT